MGVGFRVGSVVEEIGTPDFLHAFFSTISGRLEPKGWGTRFPELMGPLYQGALSAEDGPKVLRDLRTIRRELKAYPPWQVIWDIDLQQAKPPWGDQISSGITDLSNYFVTSRGKDLFEVLTECLQTLKQEGGVLTIE
jgi:2,3-bisphosphoglycerate-dependent phosphoglycerate mutase